MASPFNKGTRKPQSRDARGVSSASGRGTIFVDKSLDLKDTSEASGRNPKNTSKALKQADDDHDIPLDYELNVMLDKIAQNLTANDLNRMKRYYSGEGGLGRRVQEEITDPLQFFDHMQRSGRLDRNNLLYLQAILWHLGRKDVYDMFVQCARKCNTKPLHFYTRDEHEDHPGRSSANFHISGEAIDRCQVQQLQGLLAKLLIVPEEEISLNGVKPFHSIVITFLIPDSALTILKDLTSEEKGLLQQCDVDCAFIGDLKISFTDKKYTTPTKLNERDEILKLLERNKQLEMRMEDLEVELLKKDKKLSSLQRSTVDLDTPEGRKSLTKRETNVLLFPTDSFARLKSGPSHHDLLNEISVLLTTEQRMTLSEGYTFTDQEQEHLQQNKQHFLRVLVDKDIKTDTRNRVLELIRKLENESLLVETTNLLDKLPEIDIDWSIGPTFDEDPDVPTDSIK
ncbi:uncharacterized protein [Argopecten irradians]|uniref:uncharacterized protein n=1 Tax=Argopecten irradians TaxID=31199 RepID=UPI0037197CC5